MTKGVRGRPIASRNGGGNETRQRLLEAALELFDMLGYHEANLRRIGDRAEVDHALVVRHFESKSLLFAAVVNHALDVAWSASASHRPKALMRVARLMLAAAYAPPEVRAGVISAVSVRIGDGDRPCDPAGRDMGRRLGDAVCQQLARLLLTLRTEEPGEIAAVNARLYGHLGQWSPGNSGDRSASDADPAWREKRK